MDQEAMDEEAMTGLERHAQLRKFTRHAMPEPRAATGFAPLETGDSLARFAKVLGKHWKLLLGLVAFAAIAALTIQVVVPKRYVATALVKVDRHAAGGVVGAEATQVSSIDDMDQLLATQMELAQSETVLRPVVERYRLLELEKQLAGLNAEESQRKREGPIKLRGLTVTRPPNSYLLQITYRAHDPQLAADVANAIAQSLSEHAGDTGRRSAEQISAIVAQDMAALREKMRESAQQLAEYEKQLNMVDPEQHATILTARLAQLNTEYTAAQAERIRRQAVRSQVQGSNTLAAAQAAAQDSLLNETVQRLNVARQQFASARSYYGEGHPEYAKARQQVEEVQRELDELKSGTKERATADERQTLAREDLLRQLVQETKAQVDSLKASAHQYEQLKSEANNDKKIYEDLETRTRLAGINQEFQNATVQVAARALAPQAAAFPKLLINLPLALIFAGILGVLAMVVLDALHPTFADAEEIGSRFQIDVLAAIPDTKGLPPAWRGSTSGRAIQAISRYWQAVLDLRTVMSLLARSQPFQTLLVTSAEPGEGKSTTAAHLAQAYAQLGKRVLLIDADLRHPTLHRQFRVDASAGLSQVLRGELASAQAVQETETPGLFLLPAGDATQRPADLIEVGFAALLDHISHAFDLVIVDAPSVLGVPETMILASLADCVLFVARANVTTEKAIGGALACLMRAEANVLGLTMSRVKRSGRGYYSDGGATDIESRRLTA